MKKLLYICLFPLLGIACMDDLGTYDYNALNEIIIDTLSNRTIEIYNQLEVEPNIRFSREETPLEYCWYRYIDNTLEMDTLSLEEKLNYNVSLPVGDYTIYLKVTDTKTGLSGKATFVLSVVGMFDNGLMVLGEVDGIPNLVFLNTAGNLIEVYGPDNGSHLGSHPVLVADASATQIPTLQDMLVLCHDDRGGVTLTNADLSTSSLFSDLFYVAPEVINPQAYYKGVYPISYGNQADFIINNGKLHGRFLATAYDFGYELLFNPAVPGDYELSPYAIVNGRNFLFYDNKGGRFLNLRGSMMQLYNTFSSVSSTTAGFDPSDLGLELVYMAEGMADGNNSNYRGYGIFKDANGQLEMLKFSLGSFTGTSSASMSLITRTNVTSEAVGIDESPSYAMSLAKPYLYYTQGSKIYLYGLDNNTCIPVYDTDTVSINGNTAQTTIDRIYMEYVPYYYGYGSTSDDYNTILYVASSGNGSQGKCGSIHILKLAENGTVLERRALYENVCGKTVSMGYKR